MFQTYTNSVRFLCPEQYVIITLALTRKLLLLLVSSTGFDN